MRSQAADEKNRTRAIIVKPAIHTSFHSVTSKIAFDRVLRKRYFWKWFTSERRMMMWCLSISQDRDRSKRGEGEREEEWRTFLERYKLWPPRCTRVFGIHASFGVILKQINITTHVVSVVVYPFYTGWSHYHALAIFSQDFKCI